MVEIEYFRAKSKILELQNLALQLQGQLAGIQSEKNLYITSLGLDPKKNYSFDDVNFEFKDANQSPAPGDDPNSKGNS